MAHLPVPGALVLLAVAAALVAAPAAAQPAPSSRIFGTEDDPPPALPPGQERIVMRLQYTRAEGCPDDAVVRASIGAQVKRWDPFAPNAPWLLTVGTVRGRRGYEGQAELRDVFGAVVWSRPLLARARCADLVEDLAVALAFKINPPRQAPAPAASAGPDIAPPAEPAAASPSPPPPTTVAFRAGASAWVDLASAPRPAFGLNADVGLRAGWFSVAAELRWDPPAAATVSSGVEVGTARLLAALVPCGHVGSFAGGGSFFGCLAGEVGQLRATLTNAHLPAAEPQAMLTANLGGRLGVEIPLVRGHLFARVAVDLRGALVRPGFRTGPEGATPAAVWRSPAVNGGLGAGLLASF